MKKLALNLKGLLGFCQWKGCKNRSEYDIDIPAIKTTRHLCTRHVQEVVKGASLKSVSYEKTINFDE